MTIKNVTQLALLLVRVLRLGEKTSRHRANIKFSE